MLKTITEGQAVIKAHTGKISRELPVFYNPVMKSNRDISIEVLKTLNKKNRQIALPLAASGIRGIRFIKELPKSIIKNITFNDFDKKAVNSIKNNLKLNKIKSKKIQIKNQEANLFLLQSTGFDYIDIDPFGSPNPFLNNAIQRLARDGILAVTSTDTSALTGTFPKVTRRKYWATSFKNEMMHELGLRILIRKIQLIGTQFEKALTPILAYYKDHYFRIYFQNKKSKEACDQIIKQHQFFLYNPKTLERKISKYNQENNFIVIGPLWTGDLFNKNLTKKIRTKDKFLNIIKKESNIVGFYDLHKIAKTYKINIKSTQKTIQNLKATPTHFSTTGFKTNLKIKEILKKI
ncbi:MAG: hypothetical protein KAT77_01595 [Nanoarchaeota archaeon]|nr:hypothetical protein [Nanoarchaeota archaeon]